MQRSLAALAQASNVVKVKLSYIGKEPFKKNLSVSSIKLMLLETLALNFGLRSTQKLYGYKTDFSYKAYRDMKAEQNK